jgi:hypothetical protein
VIPLIEKARNDSSSARSGTEDIMAQTRRTRRPGPAAGRRLNPRREIELHLVSDGPSKGWLHTHGLAAHGKPELEIRNVPLFLGPLAAGLLNDFADYLLNDATAPLLADQLVQIGRSTMQVVARGPDEPAGYDAAHYERGVRLTLVDPPPTGCECDECAMEAAGRSRFLS